MKQETLKKDAEIIYEYNEYFKKEKLPAFYGVFIEIIKW